MALPILGALLGVGEKLIDKLIPDPQAKADAKYKLLELAQSGELAKMANDTQLAMGQIELNKVEAASDSLFKSGWRPSVGWICSVGLFYQFLGQPLITWMSGIYAFPAPPSLNLTDLFTLLFGMLGLGAYRTYEKREGVN